MALAAKGQGARFPELSVGRSSAGRGSPEGRTGVSGLPNTYIADDADWLKRRPGKIHYIAWKNRMLEELIVTRAEARSGSSPIMTVGPPNARGASTLRNCWN